ncbi:Uncharacterised protein [Yersinia massiliensis]|nr:Uncharacterised protein [Yersinia massiliensis]
MDGTDLVSVEDWIWFRLIGVRRSPEPRSFNRAGGQAGPPAPAACAKYCGFAIPSGSLLAYRTGADSLPARQPLSPRPCGSFGLQSLSAIFLIALKIKSQKNGFDLEV